MENLIVEEDIVALSKIDASSTISIKQDISNIAITAENKDMVYIQTNESIIGGNATILVMTQPETLAVVSQGARGPAGISEEEIMYSKRVDFVNDDVVYRGEAAVGTLDTEGFWRIRKITISTLDGDIIETWAGGTALFDKVWDSRLSYTYI